MKPSIAFSAVAASLLIPAQQSVAAESPAERLMALQRPLVIAHRGYSAAAPENTLPAFQLGVTTGSDLVELDYHHSKDDVLTVLHDSTLDRTTDATKRWGRTNLHVSQFTTAELQTLNASSWRGSNQPPATIPTLDQALDVIQSGSVTLIERKAGPASACVQLLRSRKLINEVVVQAFDWEYLEEYHRLEPSQILGALGPWGSYRGQKLSDADKDLSARWIDEARRIGARAIVWNRQVSAAAVQDAHTKGIQVWVYTIDDPALMKSLIAMGVDGIITNNPGLAWKTCAEASHPKP
jgi:glycerophosphoryl diester phosphodiesterase